MIQTFAIELPWWTVLFMFGLPLAFIFCTVLLAVATYRMFRKSPHNPAKLITIIALWVALGATWLYLRRVF